MIDFVCFKWKPIARYRSTFTSVHVNVLYSMIKRNYTKPFRLTCITDDPAGLHPSIRVLELWRDHANIPNPSNPDRGPSCYRRLKVFERNAGDWLGQRIIMLDIDCVITGSLHPVVDREEDFVIWGDTNLSTPYNGSLIMFNAGCRPQIWETFDPIKSPALGKKLGYYGSDQAWISACLGPHEEKFSVNDGVFSYKNDLRNKMRLPQHARLVIMHGQIDPWSHKVKNVPWIKQHWQ